MNHWYAVVKRPKPDGSGDEFRPLRGPYVSHTAAQEALPAAIAQAVTLDPASATYAFGIARCLDYQGPGMLDVLDGIVKH